MYSAPNRIPHGAVAEDFSSSLIDSGFEFGTAFAGLAFWRSQRPFVSIGSQSSIDCSVSLRGALVCPLTTESMECVLAFILFLFQDTKVGSSLRCVAVRTTELVCQICDW